MRNARDDKRYSLSWFAIATEEMAMAGQGPPYRFGRRTMRVSLARSCRATMDFK